MEDQQYYSAPEQHVYHHNDKQFKVNMKIEKNSRSINWEVTILNANSVDEALEALQEAEQKLSRIYSVKVE